MSKVQIEQYFSQRKMKATVPANSFMISVEPPETVKQKENAQVLAFFKGKAMNKPLEYTSFKLQQPTGGFYSMELNPLYVADMDRQFAVLFRRCFVMFMVLLATALFFPYIVKQVLFFLLPMANPL
mgnify:FL=1